MKSRKLIMVLLILFILTINISSISASDNLNNNTIAESPDDINEVKESENEDILEYPTDESESADNSISSDAIYVKPNPNNPNQVLSPTVQPAIDKANPGDTLILDGEFVHCHFTINKTLNIIASENAILGPCPHHKHAGLTEFGIFYITEEGSGSLIQGFSYLNGNDAKTPFTYYIEGASNVTIRDCTMNLTDFEVDQFSGITVKNSDNIVLSNLFINNTISGIKIIDSSNVVITDCIIVNGNNQGILVAGNSSNITIKNNRIMNNGKTGINLTSTDHINILNNVIENNGINDAEIGSGIYVNANITKLTVKGNMFSHNRIHAILYDYRVRNMNDDEGDELLTVVDNNYFLGQSSMILHHRIYIEFPNGGMAHDSENDVFYPSSNGNYIESKTFSYMQHAMVQDQVMCGFTYITPTIPWAMKASGNDGEYNLSLKVSEITQLEKGVYQVSIVDNDGNIASDFSSFDVTFYLNNFSTTTPQENEIFKTVKIENGTATVDFTDLKDYYLESGNVITVSFPGASKYVENNPHSQLKVNDRDIPRALNYTQISADNLNLKYGSGDYLTATLSDVNGRTLANKSVSIELNGKTYDEVTDSKGEIRLLVSLNCGTYNALITFNGDDEFSNSTNTSKITVSKIVPKLTASTLTTYPISDRYYKVKLTGINGKAIAKQTVAFKINGKTYYAKTDQNGIAKVTVSLTAKKTYPVTVSYAGNSIYAAVKKTGKITVKTGFKASKITAYNMKIKRNTKKVFSFKLTSAAGKAISKQKVAVKVNGKTYIVKTNTNGIAKITVKFNAAKKYSVKMSFLGNSNFKAVTKTKSITVVK